ncbi:MAG TPA: sorbosone dehydrogenase family protein [Vicinamibacterales bacterium]|nr:sorbosone dehydrogenase family protein [Vicinamibacterales bacterium]
MTRHVHSRLVRPASWLTLWLTAIAAAGCGGATEMSVAETTGPAPQLPQPKPSLIPTINVVEASPWPEGTAPQAGAGLQVQAFARGLDHPRWLYVLPNGDVLVAETNAPPRPDEGKGFKGWLFKRYQKKAGGAVPSANRITLLRDSDHDGVADIRTVFLSGLNAPFGMALAGDTLYVANTDAVVRFPYTPGATQITAAPLKVVDLPAGTLNHHWTKNIIASQDGTRLYAAVGSNSNVAEHGIDKEEGRAAIWEIDLRTGTHRVFATGLRNPVGMAWEPELGMLWTAVNERDELGNDLVPDYITSVKENGFYGWPYSYFGANVDDRVKPPRPDLVARAIKPDYALGAHTASLGLAYVGMPGVSPTLAGGMFVGQHGSWNRKPFSGYKVIFVPFEQGRPSGAPVDVLTGFLRDDGKANGRPVGVAIDAGNGLLVADDVGNAVWRVTGIEGDS